MTLRIHPLPPVPDDTAAVVYAAFPKGNLYVDLRTEFGTVYDDQLFVDLYTLTVRPEVHHEALQAARQRQETLEFKAQYALQAGVESSLSQGIRRFDLRQSRYIGLGRTHLQQLLNATAMNLVRAIAWLWGEPLGERRRKPGYFAGLAPHSLSRQAVLCQG
jgi:Transposase DDE domain